MANRDEKSPAKDPATKAATAMETPEQHATDKRTLDALGEIAKENAEGGSLRAPGGSTKEGDALPKQPAPSSSLQLTDAQRRQIQQAGGVKPLGEPSDSGDATNEVFGTTEYNGVKMPVWKESGRVPLVAQRRTTDGRHGGDKFGASPADAYKALVSGEALIDGEALRAIGIETEAASGAIVVPVGDAASFKGDHGNATGNTVVDTTPPAERARRQAEARERLEKSGGVIENPNDLALLAGTTAGTVPEPGNTVGVKADDPTMGITSGKGNPAKGTGKDAGVNIPGQVGKTVVQTPTGAQEKNTGGRA